jgi:hypothetical protein
MGQVLRLQYFIGKLLALCPFWPLSDSQSLGHCLVKRDVV